jgi:hypothetical protein
MVKSHKMMETEMGYRGSKSEQTLGFGSVKEQRVDGSWYNFKPLYLRYTLMGSESCYPVKIPSKQLNNRKFSNFSSAATISFNTKFNTCRHLGF